MFVNKFTSVDFGTPSFTVMEKTASNKSLSKVLGEIEIGRTPGLPHCIQKLT